MKEAKSLVPKLRFAEFSDIWKKKKLGDIAIFLDERRKPIKSSDRAKIKGEYPYYGASGIIDFVDSYIFDEEIILLGEDGENILSRNLPLAFKVTSKCWVNNHAHVIKPKKGTDIDFLTINLERVNYVVYNTGTAQPKLNQEICKGIYTNFPTLPEQQKIATFLSAVNKKLEQLQQKKTLLEEYKKGVMQQLFSRALRFTREDGSDYADWEEKKLGAICEINKGSQLNAEFLTKDGTYPCINGGICESGFTENFNREAKTITISEGGNSCGFINFIRTRFWSGGHCYSIDGIKPNILNLFLYHILKFNEIHIMRLRVGSGLPNIQKKDILKFQIELPSIEEQTKIANFLSTLDKKIELVTNQIENSQQFKKGLLQQMFV